MQQVADLFCGAGGTSTGVLQAAHELGQSVNLVAINRPCAGHYISVVEKIPMFTCG